MLQRNQQVISVETFMFNISVDTHNIITTHRSGSAWTPGCPHTAFTAEGARG